MPKGITEHAVSWKILVERGNLGFSAAHFITMAGTCEPLHGHNYGVRVEVTGELTPDSLLLDFVTLKDVVRALCKEWEHRFLLPLRNPHLAIRETADGEWEIRADAHTRYLMPQSTVVALPVDNATTERLAELLAHRLAEALQQRGLNQHLNQLTVGVEETEMQTAFYTMTLAHGAPRASPAS
jgi:6-pyruvoyltetrahydropterin/6-carboxytetrahydropterin synthase